MAEHAIADTPSIHRNPARALVAGALLLALAVAVRLWGAGQSLWLDELHTSWVVHGPWSQVVPRAAIGNQGPLYFLLVKGLVGVCGQSEWSLRLLSLLAGSGLVVSLAWLVTRVTGQRWAGAFAGLAIALQADAVFYAQEARPYAVVQLLTLWHGTWFMQQMRRPTAVGRAVLIGGAVALFYLHYTSVLFLLAEAVCWGWTWAAGDGRYRPSQVLLDVFCTLAAMLPALSHLQQIGARRAQWDRIVDPWPHTSQIWPWLVLLVVPALAVGGHRLWSGRRALGVGRVGLARQGRWWLCWALVPPAVAWVATVAGWASLWMLRYYIASLAALPCLAAAALVRLPPRLRQTVAVGLLAGLLMPYGLFAQWSRTGHWGTDRGEGWRPAVNWLNDHLRPRSDLVLSCAGLLEDRQSADPARTDLRSYCRFPFRGIYWLQADEIEPLPTRSDLTLDDRHRQLIARHTRVWLLVRARPQTALRLIEGVRRSMSAPGAVWRVADSRTFGRLQLVHFECATGFASVGAVFPEDAPAGNWLRLVLQ